MIRLGERLGLLCLAHALELLADALLALPLDALRLQPLRLHALCLQPLCLQPRLLRCLLSLLFGLTLLRHGDPRGPSTGPFSKVTARSQLALALSQNMELQDR